MDEKTKSEITYVIGYMEGVTFCDPDTEYLKKPIAILRELIGLDEIKEPTK